MISARQDIANATAESIKEWGFSVKIVYLDGSTITPTVNGRKTSTDINSEGMEIVNNNPYLSIAIEELGGAAIPGKGCTVQTPADFFRPGDPESWWSVERAGKDDEDWFVKIYLTTLRQESE